MSSSKRRSSRRHKSVEDLGCGFEEVNVPSDACCIDYTLPEKFICLGCNKFLDNIKVQLDDLFSRNKNAWSTYQDHRKSRASANRKLLCERPFDRSKFLPDPKKKKEKGQFRPTNKQRARCVDICQLISEKRKVNELDDEQGEDGGSDERQVNELDDSPGEIAGSAVKSDSKKRLDPSLKMPASISKKQVKACTGWTGEKFRPLISASLQEQLKNAPPQATRVTNSFQISSGFSSYKDFGKLVVTLEGVVGVQPASTDYVIRATTCNRQAATNKGRLCSECSALSNSLASINRKVSTLRDSVGVRSHATERKMSVMSPDAAASFVKDVRTYKNNEIDNLTKLVSRLKIKLAKRSDSFREPNTDNQATLKLIVERAAPIVKARYGENSLQAAVFTSSLEMMSCLAEGKNPKGFRYPDEVITFALFLLHRCDKATYNKLAELLHLPTRRYILHVKAVRFGCTGDGPHEKSIQEAVDTIERSDLSEKEKAVARKVYVTWDSARMRGCILLSTRKEDNCGLVGIVHTDNESIAEQEFNNFLSTVKRGLQEEEEGNETARVDVHAEELAGAFEENTEHTVFYALSKSKKLYKLEFIAGIFNTPSIQAHHVAQQVDDVTRRLAHYGLDSEVGTSDAASANQSWANTVLSVKASDILGKELLEPDDGRHKLDGDILVGCRRWWEEGLPDDERGFFFAMDDSVHVMKRTGNQMRNKDFLCWGGASGSESPMSMTLLKDCFDVWKKEHGINRISDPQMRKLTVDHFITNAFNKMKVKLTVQVLSQTMARLVREVRDNPSKYPLRTDHRFNGNGDAQAARSYREKAFTRILELVEKMDRFFDICNSRDNRQPGPAQEFLWTDERNAKQVINELLDLVRWLEEWKDASTDESGEVSWEHFLAKETFHSLKLVCYGFSSIIWWSVLEKSEPVLLKKIMQDIVENHFGHLRAGRGTTNLFNQQQGESTATIATLNRNVKGAVTAGNVTTGTAD